MVSKTVWVTTVSNNSHFNCDNNCNINKNRRNRPPPVGFFFFYKNNVCIIIYSMIDVEKVYQMFILGTGNLENPLKKGLGGVIFFTKDISSKEQFITLISKIKSSAKIPLFLSIDQEGGRVERTEKIHERYLSPKFAYLKGEKFLKEQTQCIADELKSYGINMNFAPCLDVNSNPNNPIIGERAFSDNVDDVCRGYDIVADIYRKNNIVPVIKHFPGHGDASKDSHKELPLIDLSMTDMENVHIKPFRHAIRNSAEAIMVAHLHCTCFDKEELPTSLSLNCINYLRNNLNYNGLIVSDDMIMNGVMKYGMNDACLMGIKAGINMFIYRNSDEDTLNVIEHIIKCAEKDINLREKIEFSNDKIMHLKSTYNLI